MISLLSIEVFVSGSAEVNRIPRNLRKFRTDKSPKPPKKRKIPEWMKPDEAILNTGIVRLKWKRPEPKKRQ